MADYATIQQISARLGDQVRSVDIAYLESKITPASRAIDQWCGQEFGTAAEVSTRTFLVDNQHTVLVDPFHTTTGLVIKTDADDDGTFETTWAAADYALGRFGGRQANLLSAPYDRIVAVGSHRFPVGNLRPEPLQVTAKWGWAATPTVVAEACQIITLDLWARKDTPLGVTQPTVDFAGLRIGRDVMAQAASLLAPFRRVERTMGIA